MEWEQLLNPVRTRQIEGGRGSESTSPSEARTEFERDFDRSVFSSPVRRLQDKAQVWPLERSDFVRTRLTHSLEVSSVARGLATAVGKRLVSSKYIEADEAASIQVIAATCGLLHDLGNPPFGHAGEEAMQAWYKQHLTQNEQLVTALGGEESQKAQDFLRFDGNPQTIRVVAHLQMLADTHGLNLTAATLSALCKYTARSNEVTSAHERSKPGFFASEDKLISEIRELTGTQNSRNPLTYLIEASDDIVYSSVDIEDGLRKGVLSWKQLREALHTEDENTNGVIEELFTRSEQYIAGGGLTLSGSALDEAQVQILRTYIIGKQVSAATEAFQSGYKEIMDGTYRGELLENGITAGFHAALKKVAREHVFKAPSILRLEVMGRKVIHDLMNLFWEGASGAPDDSKAFRRSFAGKIYALMSANYRRIFEHQVETLGAEYARLQLVADYVAGMTDTFATDLHRQLTNG